MGRFTVDVYADTVCPWCYIGKKSLDTAIEKHRKLYPEDEFQLNWRPYILFPNAKVSGESLTLLSSRDSFFPSLGPPFPSSRHVPKYHRHQNTSLSQKGFPLLPTTGLS